MNRGELTGKLWFLCGLQDTITDRSVNLGRVIGRIKGPARQELEREMEQAQAKRHEVINEILEAFDEEGPGITLILAEHHVQGLETINQTLIRQINDARRWAAAWKKAARQNRHMAHGWRDMFNSRAITSACNDARRWAAAWKKAAKRARWAHQVSRWDAKEAMRQYMAQQKRACQAEQERDEAKAECTRLAENSYAADLHRARVQLRRTYQALDREKHGHMHMVGAYAESQDRLGQALEQRDTLAAELDDARAEIARLSVVVDRLARELGRFGLPYSVLIGASKLAKVTGADRETDYERMEQEERQALRFW